MTAYPSPSPTEPPRKDHHTRNTWFTIGGILATIFLVVALFALATKPSPQPARINLNPPSVTLSSEVPTSTTPPLSMNGVPVPFDWYSGTGTAALNGAEWSTTAVSTYGSAPKSGAFLTIDVVVTGVSGTVPANPYFWHVQDAQGHIYDWSWDSKEPSLHLADLTPGEVSSGFVTFDVAQAPVTVTLTNGTATLARWAVPGA